MSLISFDIRALGDAPAVRVWRHRDYALFMTGIGPHYITGWMQRIGVGWLAWELTHSPAWLGAVAAADLAPMLLIAPFAGAIVDRWNPHAQMKLALLAIIVHAIVLAGLTVAGLMTIELLLAITLVNGMLMPVYNAARTTIVPACVPRSDFPSAVSLDSSFFHGSRFVGPMLAALVITQWGVGACFVAHVVGLAFFILQVFRMNVSPPSRKQAGGSIWNDVTAGLAYVRGHPGIFPLFMLMTVSSLAARPLQDFLPGFAGGVFGSGADGLAVLTAGMGVGAMIGATWIALRGHTRGLVKIVVVCMVGLGIAQLGFVSTTSLWLAFGWAALSGLTLTVMATGIAALVQMSVNDSMRGRVMSLLAMIYRGVPAIGALAMGFAAEGIGLRATFAFAALGCIVAWLWMAPGSKAIESAMQESAGKRGG
jgi:MFS family permease